MLINKSNFQKLYQRVFNFKFISPAYLSENVWVVVWESECIPHSALDEPIVSDGKSPSPVTNLPPVYSCSRACNRGDEFCCSDSASGQS